MILGATKIDIIWRKHNRESENIFGDLDLVSCIRINRLNWIDHVNRMDADRKPKLSSIINQREIDTKVDPRIIGGIVCKLIYLIQRSNGAVEEAKALIGSGKKNYGISANPAS